MRTAAWQLACCARSAGARPCRPTTLLTRLLPLPPLTCLQYRGDQDDRMLTEAVAPLLEQLASSADVASPLARRFNMQK